jgi:hypothetical protein
MTPTLRGNWTLNLQALSNHADMPHTLDEMSGNMRHKIAALIIAVFVAILTGCSTPNCTISSAISDSVPTDVAHIIIHRNRQFSGGIYPQHIFDKGDAITYDTTLDTSLRPITGTNGITTFISPSPDAKAVGTAGNGDDLIYDRRPGTMKLVIYNRRVEGKTKLEIFGVGPPSMRKFIPVVNVEGGKAYRIAYDFY